MILSERLFVLTVVLCSVVLCENNKDSKRQGRHFLALLGYLHGYKIGQEYALQIPQYIITPVVIVPSVNQQQSVNIQQASNDENYQENGENIQTIAPSRIVSADNASTSKIYDIETFDKMSDDIKVKKPTKPNDENLEPPENVTDTLRQNIESNSNSTANLNETSTNKTLSVNTTSEEIKKNETVVVTGGHYPSPFYNNQMIDTIMLTTETPLPERDQPLPPVVDNRWQNFTLRANLRILPDVNNNSTMTNEQPNNTTPPSFSTEYPKGSKGPYPSAWYNNEAIDQLSITTNYYTNESPLQTNDGWGSYSSMNTLPSGFRPLAGLYYDGFLHTPVKKYGFVPKNYWR